MWKLAKRIAPWVVIGVSFAFVGWFVGWYSGASQSPVGAAILPVIIGLLVTSTAFFAPGAVSIQDIAKGKSKSAGSSRAAGGTASPWWMAGWCALVATFSLGCNLGVEAGVGRRVPKLRSVSEMIGSVNAAPKDMAELQVLRFHLMKIGATREDVEEVFKTTIVPLLVDSTELEHSSIDGGPQPSGQSEEPMRTDPERFREPETEIFPDPRTRGYTPLPGSRMGHNEGMQSVALTSIVNRFLTLKEYKNPRTPTSANGSSGDY